MTPSFKSLVRNPELPPSPPYQVQAPCHISAHSAAMTPLAPEIFDNQPCCFYLPDKVPGHSMNRGLVECVRIYSFDFWDDRKFDQTH